MYEVKIYKPRCSGCSCLLQYSKPVPKKVKGAFLRCGERYCTGGKNTRAFKKSDPRVYLPSWCPRLLSPAILRIYCYKDSMTEYLQMMLRADGMADHAFAHNYAVRHECRTTLSASALGELMGNQSLAGTLGMPVLLHEIVEIDDGIKPYSFYVLDLARVVCISFDGEAARKNVLECRPPEI